jgi:hypothetical protein
MGKLECMSPLLFTFDRIHKLTVHLRQMGIFLCMRCAALHRKLGTHISKIKSLTMDTWTSEQVDVSTMRQPAIAKAMN